MTGIFRAYRIFQEEGGVRARWTDLTLDDLDTGEVLIRTHYSSVNYKDALAATGKGKIIRRFPCVGGIDAAGIVESSEDPRFVPGNAVLVTGYDLGVAHDGGYSEYVRVPADWVVPLPQGLTLFEAMALGTAGFTAALAIHLLEHNGLEPAAGSVIVTGATGGVGSLAIAMLAQRGYSVTALTGKSAEAAYLRSLGADNILMRSEVDFDSGRPLEKGLWAGALDAVGGSTLAWLTRTMLPHGGIASFGNAGGVELHTTVFPFILRGIHLLGVDSAATHMPLRRQIWQRLSTDLRPEKLTDIACEVPFTALPEVCERVMCGQTRGRNVVRILR